MRAGTQRPVVFQNIPFTYNIIQRGSMSFVYLYIAQIMSSCTCLWLLKVINTHTKNDTTRQLKDLQLKVSTDLLRYLWCVSTQTTRNVIPLYFRSCKNTDRKTWSLPGSANILCNEDVWTIFLGREMNKQIRIYRLMPGLKEVKSVLPVSGETSNRIFNKAEK